MYVHSWTLSPFENLLVDLKDKIYLYKRHVDTLCTDMFILLFTSSMLHNFYSVFSPEMNNVVTPQIFTIPVFKKYIHFPLSTPEILQQLQMNRCYYFSNPVISSFWPFRKLEKIPYAFSFILLLWLCFVSHENSVTAVYSMKSWMKSCISAPELLGLFYFRKPKFCACDLEMWEGCHDVFYSILGIQE